LALFVNLPQTNHRRYPASIPLALRDSHPFELLQHCLRSRRDQTPPLLANQSFEECPLFPEQRVLLRVFRESRRQIRSSPGPVGERGLASDGMSILDSCRLSTSERVSKLHLLRVSLLSPDLTFLTFVVGVVRRCTVSNEQQLLSNYSETFSCVVDIGTVRHIVPIVGRQVSYILQFFDVTFRVP